MMDTGIAKGCGWQRQDNVEGGGLLQGGVGEEEGGGREEGEEGGDRPRPWVHIYSDF